MIGTDVTGAAGLGNKGDGVAVIAGTSNAIDQNTISGNGGAGVHLLALAATANAPPVDAADNVVRDNRIGTNAAGTPDASFGGNAADGVNVAEAVNTTIVANLISNNGGDGIDISNPRAIGTVIQANTIGLDATGAQFLSNRANGINAAAGTGTLIGGTTTGAGNVISGNLADGLRIDVGATNTLVQGNRVGTDRGGMTTGSWAT